MVGLVGSGALALALARGWGEPVLASDAGSGRAAALVDEVGGEALGSNAELARRADIVVLCHPPTSLEEVGAEIAPHTGLVVSLLAAIDLARLRAALPGATAVRAMTNVAVEIRRGTTCIAAGDGADVAHTLLSRVGTVAVVPEELMAAAGATIGVTPAYVALLVEAQVDVSVGRGLPAELATELVAATFEGAAALVRAKGGNTLAVRRAVASPGGATARGLAALEERGLRPAFNAAMAAVIDGDHRAVRRH